VTYPDGTALGCQLMEILTAKNASVSGTLLPRNPANDRWLGSIKASPTVTTVYQLPLGLDGEGCAY
jgi:hypothetical protein